MNQWSCVSDEDWGFFYMWGRHLLPHDLRQWLKKETASPWPWPIEECVVVPAEVRAVRTFVEAECGDSCRLARYSGRPPFLATMERSLLHLVLCYS